MKKVKNIKNVIKIKPHHFIDIICSVSQGNLVLKPHVYGHSVHSVTKEILAGHDSQSLEIEMGIDDICSSCSFNVHGSCQDLIDISYRPDAPSLKREYNLLIDHRWCSRLGIKQGDIITVRDFCRRLGVNCTDLKDIYRENPPDLIARKEAVLETGLKRFTDHDYEFSEAPVNVRTDLQIRSLTSGDLKELQQISRQTFVETFGKDNTPENMQHYLKMNLGEERLLKELNNTGSEFFFLMMDGQKAGYLKLNAGTAQNELKSENCIEIERLYILRSFQGSRLGRLLLNKALDLAKQRKADFVWLGVWEKNYKAIRFYRKNRFQEFGTHAFILGDEKQTDIMMKYPIIKEHIKNEK